MAVNDTLVNDNAFCPADVVVGYDDDDSDSGDDGSLADERDEPVVVMLSSHVGEALQQTVASMSECVVISSDGGPILMCKRGVGALSDYQLRAELRRRSFGSSDLGELSRTKLRALLFEVVKRALSAASLLSMNVGLKTVKMSLHRLKQLLYHLSLRWDDASTRSTVLEAAAQIVCARRLDRSL